MVQHVLCWSDTQTAEVVCIEAERRRVGVIRLMTPNVLPHTQKS